MPLSVTTENCSSEMPLTLAMANGFLERPLMWLAASGAKAAAMVAASKGHSYG